MHQASANIQAVDMPGGPTAGLRPKSNFLSPTYFAGNEGVESGGSFDENERNQYEYEHQEKQEAGGGRGHSLSFGAVNSVINRSPPTVAASAAEQNLGATAFLSESSLREHA